MKSRNKSTIVVIILVIAICLIIGRRLYYDNKINLLSSGNTTKIDLSTLPVCVMKGDFIYDTDSKEEAVGMADYVFLGEVVSKDGTDYEDAVMTEDENGDAIELAAPYTNYSVNVLENVKGELQKDSTIKLKKHGGITQDKKSIILFDNDSLPEIGEQYLFLAYAQPDGSLLVSGPNSNVLDKDVRGYSNSEADNNIITEYREAFENEVIAVDRKRFVSKYEK